MNSRAGTGAKPGCVRTPPMQGSRTKVTQGISTEITNKGPPGPPKEGRGPLREIDPWYIKTNVYRRAASAAIAAATNNVLPAKLTLEAAPGKIAGPVVLDGGATGGALGTVGVVVFEGGGGTTGPELGGGTGAPVGGDGGTYTVVVLIDVQLATLVALEGFSSPNWPPGLVP